MFLAFVFPETNGAPNLTTIDEALLFYKGELTADKDDENEKFLHWKISSTGAFKNWKYG